MPQRILPQEVGVGGRPAPGTRCPRIHPPQPPQQQQQALPGEVVVGGISEQRVRGRQPQRADTGAGVLTPAFSPGSPFSPSGTPTARGRRVRTQTMRVRVGGALATENIAADLISTGRGIYVSPRALQNEEQHQQQSEGAKFAAAGVKRDSFVGVQPRQPQQQLPQQPQREYAHALLVRQREYVVLPPGLTLETFRELLDWWHTGQLSVRTSPRRHSVRVRNLTRPSVCLCACRW